MPCQSLRIYDSYNGEIESVGHALSWYVDSINVRKQDGLWEVLKLVESFVAIDAILALFLHLIKTNRNSWCNIVVCVAQ